MELSEATTGSMLKPVMNLMSSIANTLVGVHHCDGEGRADPAQGKNLVALGGFKWNQLDDCRINFEVGKINGWNTILAGEENFDILGPPEGEHQQCGGEAPDRLLPDLNLMFPLVRGYDLVFLAKGSQPVRHTSI